MGSLKEKSICERKWLGGSAFPVEWSENQMTIYQLLRWCHGLWSRGGEKRVSTTRYHSTAADRDGLVGMGAAKTHEFLGRS